MTSQQHPKGVCWRLLSILTASYSPPQNTPWMLLVHAGTYNFPANMVTHILSHSLWSNGSAASNGLGRRHGAAHQNCEAFRRVSNCAQWWCNLSTWKTEAKLWQTFCFWSGWLVYAVVLFFEICFICWWLPCCGVFLFASCCILTEPQNPQNLMTISNICTPPAVVTSQKDLAVLPHQESYTASNHVKPNSVWLLHTDHKVNKQNHIIYQPQTICKKKNTLKNQQQSPPLLTSFQRFFLSKALGMHQFFQILANLFGVSKKHIRVLLQRSARSGAASGVRGPIFFFKNNHGYSFVFWVVLGFGRKLEMSIWCGGCFWEGKNVRFWRKDTSRVRRASRQVVETANTLMKRNDIDVFTLIMIPCPQSQMIWKSEKIAVLEHL